MQASKIPSSLELGPKWERLAGIGHQEVKGGRGPESAKAEATMFRWMWAFTE